MMMMMRMPDPNKQTHTPNYTTSHRSPSRSKPEPHHTTAAEGRHPRRRPEPRTTDDDDDDEAPRLKHEVPPGRFLCFAGSLLSVRGGLRCPTNAMADVASPDSGDFSDAVVADPPAGPPPAQPVHGPNPAAAADSPKESSSESSSAPPVERAKRQLVAELLRLEKRQRREETDHLDPQAVADLGRRILHGDHLRCWQELVAAQPRWIWGAEEPWRTPRILSSTSWRYVAAHFEQYNDPWLWLGGCKLLRATRTSANGSWADGKGLSLATSVVPLGLRRSNRRVTAYAWDHGGDGSSRYTTQLLQKLPCKHWLYWRARSQRAARFQWPLPGLHALCKRLKSPWHRHTLKRLTQYPKRSNTPNLNLAFTLFSTGLLQLWAVCRPCWLALLAGHTQLRYQGRPIKTRSSVRFIGFFLDVDPTPHMQCPPGQHTLPRNRSGPKSGHRGLAALCISWQFQAAIGARVAPAAAAGVGPGLWPGKLRGHVLSMQPEHTFAPKPSEKRAYKRAKLRAARSGGTMYRGRWHSVAALQALETRPSRPPPRTVRAATKTKQARITPVHCLSWNAGGLSSPIYQELLAWLDLQDKFRVVVIQETHWPDSCDFHSGGWFCILSAGNPSNPFERYAGLLVLLSKKYFQDPAVHEVLPGQTVTCACYA